MTNLETLDGRRDASGAPNKSKAPVNAVEPAAYRGAFHSLVGWVPISVPIRLTSKEKGSGYSPKPLFLMVGAGRFELPTPTTPLWCATKLRYAPRRERRMLGMRRLLVNRSTPCRQPPFGVNGSESPAPAPARRAARGSNRRADAARRAVSPVSHHRRWPAADARRRS